MDRTRVVAIAIATAELAVTLLDPQFGVIVLGNLNAASGCFGLRVEDLIDAVAVTGADSPLVAVKNYKDIFFHFTNSFHFSYVPQILPNEPYNYLTKL